MSGPRDTTALLQQLETDRATGCLTIASSDGLVGRVYLLYGHIFHAAGPDSVGETALKESLSWSDVALSFDPKTHLPTTQTIDLKKTDRAVWAGAAGHASAEPALEIHVLKRPPATSDAGIRPLSSDRRLTALSCAPMAGGCLAALVPFALIGIGGLINPNDIDGWLIAAGIAFLAMIGLSGGAYMRFRALFFRDAVNVPGALPPDEIPRIVDASAGVIAGQPELVIKTRTRSTVGKLGRCWIEFYPDGVQISQGPQHAEPRWQFAYEDILQAELVDISSSGRGMTTHRYSVRIVTAEPRMAFLFGGSVLQNSTTQALASKLREHKVTLVNEDFSF